MSEDKMTKLKATLSTLTNEEKAWVINFLVQGLFTTSPFSDEESSSQKRVAKVLHRHHSPSDDQLAAIFDGKSTPSVPEENNSWSEIISANSGKTIKPIEKWL
ncbi:MAG: hypothetical protein IKM76_03495 [Prevotella sp.]|nr:hypothetical protein [Prevotella sp.]